MILLWTLNRWSLRTLSPCLSLTLHSALPLQDSADNKCVASWDPAFIQKQMNSAQLRNSLGFSANIISVDIKDLEIIHLLAFNTCFEDLMLLIPPKIWTYFIWQILRPSWPESTSVTHKRQLMLYSLSGWNSELLPSSLGLQLPRVS